MSPKFNLLHKWLIRQHARSTQRLVGKFSPGQSANPSTSDQGFALPLAVGMGLIMIVVGMTMIVRSQNDQVTASAQKATDRALGAAETGITRYQSFLNNFRPLATYDHEDWDSLPANISGVCSTSEDEAIEAAADTEWKDISDGQYKLLSYTYQKQNPSQPDNTAPGTGTLTVEGQVNQSGTASTTRLQVKVPVQETDLNSVPVPGLWFQAGDLGQNKVRGNIITRGCSADDLQDNIDDPDGEGYEAYAFPNIAFPPLPAKPSPFLPNMTLGNVSVPANSVLELPRASDTTNDDGVYEYSVGSMVFNGGKRTVKITPGAKVTFYLDGDIDIGGNAKIVHECPRDADGNFLSGCAPTNFQIFGYKTSGTPKICISGNSSIDAFIFAPSYSAGGNGLGDGTGITGSIWVNGWRTASDCTSNPPKVFVTQNATWLSFGNLKPNLPPTISPINSWERQGVTP